MASCHALSLWGYPLVAMEHEISKTSSNVQDRHPSSTAKPRASFGSCGHVVGGRPLLQCQDFQIAPKLGCGCHGIYIHNNTRMEAVVK